MTRRGGLPRELDPGVKTLAKRAVFRGFRQFAITPVTQDSMETELDPGERESEKNLNGA